MYVYKPVVIDSTNLLSTTAVEIHSTYSNTSPYPQYFNGDVVVSPDGKSLYQSIVTDPTFGPSGIGYASNSGNGEFSYTAHGMPNGTALRLAPSATDTSSAWGNVIFGQTYFVTNSATNTFQLARTPGGTPLTYSVGVVGLGAFHKGAYSNGSSLALTDATKWAWVAPSNKWAMFGDNAGVTTTDPASLTVSIKPGPINALAMFGLTGQLAKVQVTDGLGGAVVYDNILSLDASTILDWSDYFNAAFDQLTQFALTDIPFGYLNGVVTLTLSGAGGVGVGISNLLVGNARNIGGMEWSPARSLKDYSVKAENDFGTVTVTKRGFKRTLSGKIDIPNARLNGVLNAFEAYRSELCVWIGTTISKFSTATVIYGFYTSFNAVIAYDDYTFCDLQIEGVIQ